MTPLVWRYVGESGDDRGESEPFDSREAAEAWIGAAWEDLLGDGVEEVVLQDAETGTVLYRMGLAGAGG